jgi:ornithine--oxo-acid transaminase
VEVLENRSVSAKRYEEHVNPQWARLLDVLEMNVRYTRCAGSELFDESGRRFLDFLSGYCVHNTGHNHPSIVQALKDELDRQGPAMLQSHVSELAGELGARLCALAGGRLEKVFFCNSGSEGVEAAIKFARVHTGRAGMICASGAFHGLTCGALSLMDGKFWRDGFGPLLEDVSTVPFGDLAALETHLRGRRAAAFIVEPIQAEAGICLPPAGYLEEAQRLCRKYGTLFVLDEVQTGMFRTGTFLAAHRYSVEPDIVILAKALSGGLIPCGAALMSDAIYHSVYGSLKRSLVHTSTFSENNMAMRAGLATLDVLERQELGKCAERAGEFLRKRLQEELSGYEMIEEVRGMGLLSGIAFRAPRKIGLRLAFESFAAIHPAMFGQVLVMRLFQKYGILTQICGNNFLVLKAAPPLTIEEAQLEEFVRALVSVAELVHTSATFWTDALGMARRVIHI